MDERFALLRTIEDHPDDDMPRLVFADWLQEHGEEERAEFIRVQIELARMGLSEERRDHLRAREHHLLERKREGHWFDEAESTLEWPVSWVSFRRGFPDGLSIKEDRPEKWPGFSQAWR